MSSPTRFSSKRALSNAEESEIQKMIASDPDNPEISDAQIAKGKPFAKAFPELAESIKRSRGRPRVDNPREAVTLRIDPETVARFKAKGKDWRARMARALEKTEP